MLTDIKTFIGLIISTLLISILFVFIRKQSFKADLKKPFLFVLFFLLIWCIGLILQATLTLKLNISPIYFDYFVYIGICLTPIAFLILGIKFTHPGIKLNLKAISTTLGIIPIFCLIALWTNDFHNLFYIKYSTMLSEGTYGPFFYITSAYTYILFAVTLFVLGNYSIKNIKFYLIQSLLIFIGAFVPIVVNLLGVLGIFNLSIYITPMCFSITMLCFALSIFKFGFLKITPIALKKIVNTISDSYIVLNSDMLTIDCNDTFLKTFDIKKEAVLNRNFFATTNTSKKFIEFSNKIIDAIEKTTNNNSTVTLDYHFTGIEKYFHIEVTSIFDGKAFLGTLILFKDVTQHELDMQTIKSNQDILIERERLASLGQMIGRHCS